jgi:predicted SAM-dependent methyltransferase
MAKPPKPERADGLNVNIACGFECSPEYINIDGSVYHRLALAYKLLYPFLSTEQKDWIANHEAVRRKFRIRARNCLRPLPFKRHAVDQIFCSHFLEHVYPSEAHKVLSDFSHKLKPDGLAVIVVPDMKDICLKYVNGVIDCDTLVRESLLSTWARPSVKNSLMDIRGLFGMHHRWMYDHESLVRMATVAGLRYDREATDRIAPAVAGEIWACFRPL